MFAGTKSGSGKTTITCGILQCLIDNGLSVSSFKSGPDYIDPMFHSKVLGTKSGNLDGYFTESEVLKEILYRNSVDTDISVLEGVMGYYDGIGFTDMASSYALAAQTNTPVILIVDAKGMGCSIGAVLKGFLEFRKDSFIKGVIFNRLPASLYLQAKQMAEAEGIKCFGYVPSLKNMELKSRHLGLVTAQEIKDLQDFIKGLAEELKKTLDIDGIITLAGQAESIESIDLEEDGSVVSRIPKIKIAVAMDKAFCFYYKENFQLLEELGCELIYFSPINDKKLPEHVSGLLLGGGYPEIYAKALSENTSMLKEIKEKLSAGLPAIAECGGFMYLHESLKDIEEKEYPMVGFLSGTSFMTGRLQRFGYIEMKAKKDNLLTASGESIKAHEFHYGDSDNCGTDFHALKANKSAEWDCVHATDSLYTGFPHIYFYAHKNMAKRFVEKCYGYLKSDNK
nr:cobyrinate a,c-diamide synthase [Anaerocolumna cellulosilytica]